MAQQFRALGAPAGAHSSIPSTLVGSLQLQRIRHPLWSLGVFAHIHRPHTRHTHIHIIKVFLKRIFGFVLALTAQEQCASHQLFCLGSLELKLQAVANHSVWILGTALVLWKNSNCSQLMNSLSQPPYFFSQILCTACMQGLWRPAEGVGCPGTGIIESRAGLVLGIYPVSCGRATSALNCLSRLCFFSTKTLTLRLRLPWRLII